MREIFTEYLQVYSLEFLILITNILLGYLIYLAQKTRT